MKLLQVWRRKVTRYYPRLQLGVQGRRKTYEFSVRVFPPRVFPTRVFQTSIFHNLVFIKKLPSLNSLNGVFNARFFQVGFSSGVFYTGGDCKFEDDPRVKFVGISSVHPQNNQSSSKHQPPATFFSYYKPPLAATWDRVSAVINCVS